MENKMNASQRYRYWLNYHTFQLSQERIWQPRIVYALKRQIRPVAEYLRSQGVDMTLDQLDVLVKPDEIRRVLRSLYRAVLPRYANIEAKRIQDEYGAEMRQEKAFGTPNAFWLQLVQGFMLTNGATKVVEITETTREFIRRTINRMVEDGSSVSEIASVLVNSEINVSRSRNIVRTELTNVMNLAAKGAAKRSGLVMSKTWISAQDFRTRRVPRDKFDHLHADNQTVGIDEPFNISGQLMDHPGDPAGSAGNVCRCRCTMATEAIRDEQGRLQRVPPVQSPSRITVLRPERSNITQIVTI